MSAIPTSDSPNALSDAALAQVVVPNGNTWALESHFLSDLRDFILANNRGNVTDITQSGNTLTIHFSNATTTELTIEGADAELPAGSQDDALIWENGSWRAEKVHGDNIASGTIQTVNVLDGAITRRKLGDDVELDVVMGERPDIVFWNDEDRQLIIGTSGAYEFRIESASAHSLEVGDKILVRGFSNDANMRVRLRSGINGADCSDRLAFTDGFAVLTASAAVTGYSIWLAGDHTGQLRYDVEAVVRFRGANNLAIGASKAAVAIAPDLENFPPAYSASRVYSTGQRFTYQNAVYEVLADIIGTTPPNDTYYRKVLDGSAISSTDIDARIADWAEQGNTDQIPMAKLPDVGTDGIAANLVENFAKTNFPETEVPPDKLPSIQVTSSGGSTTFGYQGQTGARSALGLATATTAGLLSSAFKAILDGLPDWIHNGSRAPKNRLPSDIVYGNALKGEWNSGHAYSAGDLIKATPTGPNATPRYFLAIRDNSNINPFETNSDWLELGVHQSIGIRVRGLWNRANAYLPGDVAVHQDELLLCTEARAANADTSPQYHHWDVLFHMGLNVTSEGTLRFTLWNEGSQLEYRDASGARFLYNRGDWTAHTYYPQNVVRHVGNRYICKQQHTASTSNEPGSSTAVNWGNYWERW